jgi:hypothetical protein
LPVNEGTKKSGQPPNNKSADVNAALDVPASFVRNKRGFDEAIDDATNKKRCSNKECRLKKNDT